MKDLTYRTVLSSVEWESQGEGAIAPQGTSRHYVQFYKADEQLLTANICQYLWEGLTRGDGLLVVAAAHRAHSVVQELGALGGDPHEALRAGRLVIRNAQDLLSQFMVDEQPDWERFQSVVGALVQSIRGAAKGKGLRAYGEMVGLLWQAGQRSAAVRLENHWNRLRQLSGFELFCGYPIDVFGSEFETGSVNDLLCTHSHLISGTKGYLERAVSFAMAEILGPESGSPPVRAGLPSSWAALPRAEATILWLRKSHPDVADKIMDRARKYYDSPGALWAAG